MIDTSKLFSSTNASQLHIMLEFLLSDYLIMLSSRYISLRFYLQQIPTDCLCSSLQSTQTVNQ